MCGLFLNMYVPLRHKNKENRDDGDGKYGSVTGCVISGCLKM